MITLFAVGCSSGIVQDATKMDDVQTGEGQEKIISPPANVDPQKTNPTPATSPQIVAQNESFRIYQPAPETVVGNSIIIIGEARVFEAVVSYSIEDGHRVLAKGHVQASKGAPEWGRFEIKLHFDGVTNPVGVISIYEESAKDGSPRNTLLIPVKFKEEVIKR